MKLTLFPRLLTLGLCSAFIMASCSDDEVPQQNTGVEDEIFDDDACSDEYLIDYVMSQFAELNDDGSLYKRTTYFRQMNESDSTAIYTIADSKTAARAKFLNLLPEAYQKKVIVANDSAEMFIPMGTSPLMLKYKEGSTDDNILATVQLPSQGAYTKIANTLTMVKSFGTNWDASWEDHVYRFDKKKIKVLTSKEPYGLASTFDRGKNDVKVEEVELSMLCYYINEDGVAQYIFVPPFGVEGNQLQLPNGRYLLSLFQAWWLPGALLETPDIKQFQKYLDVLPSPKMLSVLANIGEFGYSKSKETLKSRYGKLWIDSDLKARIDAGNYPFDSLDYYKEAKEYFEQMEDFLSIKNKYGNEVEVLAEMTDLFPYQRTEFKNAAEVDSRKYVIEHNLPFFSIATKFEKWPQERTEYELIRSLSIASSQLYCRDKNNVAYTAKSYYSQTGEWEVIEKARVFQSYFRPWMRDRNQPIDQFKKYGRSVQATPSETEGPLRIIYLLEEQL